MLEKLTVLDQFHILVLDQMSPFNRMATQLKAEFPQCWTSSTSWSLTKMSPFSDRMALDIAQEKSTLPLSKRGIICHAKLVMKVNKLLCCQRFGQNICNLFICIDVLQLQSASLYQVSDEMVLHFNVFRSIMKHYIFQKLNATLIITMDNH